MTEPSDWSHYLCLAGTGLGEQGWDSELATLIWDVGDLHAVLTDVPNFTLTTLVKMD